MPNTVPAAAEGLPKINRRKALTVTGSGLVAALTGLAASTMPAPALSAEPETVHAKVRRLTHELADCLDEWSGDLGEGWSVRVYSSSAREYPVVFVNDDAVADAKERYRERQAYETTYNTPAMRLFRRWRKAYLAAHRTTDEAALSRLVDKMNRYEKRLIAMPVNSPVEYAAKMLAATNFGTFGLGDYEARLTADAVQLVGEA